MINSVISGSAWVCGDYVSTMEICPQRRWIPGALREEILGAWALEDVVPQFADQKWALRDTGCSILVAGHGFGGGGKSIEHPIVSLKGAGIQLVLADSFARYNYRNSIDKGLPAFVCEGLREMTQSGDSLAVNLREGSVVNQRTGQRFSLVPAADFLLELLEAGGLLPHTKKRLERLQD